MQIPSIREMSGTSTSLFPICFPTGTIADMANGNFLVSHDGNNIVLNGGICPTNGLGGRPERFKTTTALSFIVNAMARQPGSELYIYDSEGSLTDRYRLASFSDLHLEDPVKREEHLQELMLRIIIKQQASDFENIDEFMTFLKENVYAFKEKHRKAFMVDTPFVVEETDERRRAMAPTFVMVDSWSHGKTLAGLKAASAEDASDPANTMQFMRDAAAKNTTLARMVNISPKLGIYFFLTAHIGDNIDMTGGPMAKPSKSLQSMKAKDKLKKVGSDYLFLVNGNWAVDNSTYMEADDKTCEYPYTDRSTSPHELSEVIVSTTRGKRRGSGDKTTLVISQSSGMITYLTNLVFLKKHKYYALGTNKSMPCLPFFPDIKMPRKKVHSVLQGNAQLRRALEITMQLCYIQYYWTTPEDMSLPASYRGLPFDITPEDLADRLERSGKKDEILNSRSWWTYMEHEQPYYSIFDILRVVRDVPPNK